MDPLDLLFERLVRAVHDTRPEFLARPFEVGELVELVPYRDVRATGAMETNDDYAHALTRLLAGERGYLFADDLLQDDLRAELASPNPDLGAYRSYLTARVTVSKEHARKISDRVPDATPVEAAPAVKPIRPSATVTQRPLDPEAAASRQASRPGCRYCGQALPEDRKASFCPHCGQDLLVRRCPACSAELESGWRFCISCGRLAEA